MSEPRKTFIRDLLRAVPATEPSVRPITSWADMERAIVAAQNFLVTAEAEEDKRRRAHEDAVREVGEARVALAEARRLWVEHSRQLLGVDVCKEEGGQ